MGPAPVEVEGGGVAAKAAPKRIKRLANKRVFTFIALNSSGGG
jgi:hypothetical protein